MHSSGGDVLHANEGCMDAKLELVWSSSCFANGIVVYEFRDRCTFWYKRMVRNYSLWFLQKFNLVAVVLRVS